jgi:hypothetical protein
MTQPGQYQIMDPVTGGEPGPSVSELAGRLVVLLPHRIDENAPNPYARPGEPNTKPELHADIFILDGGPLVFGAAPKASPPRPNPTHQVAIPAEFTLRRFQHPNIVDSCRAAIGRGVVIGVISQGVPKDPKNNPPWNLTRLADDDPRRQQVAQYLGAKAAGVAPVNKPVPLPGAQQAMPQPGQYAPAPQYAPQVPSGYPQQPQPQYAPQVLAMPAAQGYAAAQYAPMAPMPQYAPQMLQAPVPAAPQALQPPPGYEALWPQFSIEQQQAVVAQYQAQPPAGAVPNPY